MDAVPQPPAKVQPPVPNVFNVYAASSDFIAQSTQIDHGDATITFIKAKSASPFKTLLFSVRPKYLHHQGLLSFSPFSNLRRNWRMKIVEFVFFT
jgi:hypothetical protein